MRPALSLGGTAGVSPPSLCVQSGVWRSSKACHPLPTWVWQKPQGLKDGLQAGPRAPRRGEERGQGQEDAGGLEPSESRLRTQALCQGGLGRKV